MFVINNRVHLSVAECAERVDVALTTIYSWLDRHQLARIRVADRILIAEEDLSAFLAKKKDHRKREFRKKQR